MARTGAGVWETECVRCPKAAGAAAAAASFFFLDGGVKCMIGWQVELLSFL